MAGFHIKAHDRCSCCDRPGKTTTYALFHLQPRGTLFIQENTQVYEGMIIGENSGQ